MKLLDKILHRQPTTQKLGIRIFGEVPEDKRNDVEQVIQTYYTGRRDSETKVIEEIKRVTGLKVGRVSLEYSKKINMLTVYYCC